MKTCSVEGCGSPVLARGWCRHHYEGWRKYGDPLAIQRKERHYCSVEGCVSPVFGNGLCSNHYHQKYERERRLQRRMDDPRTCGFCGAQIPPEKRRRGSVSYCNRTCKGKARTASGKGAVDARKSYYKTKFGLTVEQVEELEAKGCAICGTMDWTGRHGRPHLDHDHATGVFRGLLCHNCNVALGHFHDDPALLEAALAYLRRPILV